MTINPIRVQFKTACELLDITPDQRGWYQASPRLFWLCRACSVA